MGWLKSFHFDLGVPCGVGGGILVGVDVGCGSYGSAESAVWSGPVSVIGKFGEWITLRCGRGRVGVGGGMKFSSIWKSSTGGSSIRDSGRTSVGLGALP